MEQVLARREEASPTVCSEGYDSAQESGKTLQYTLEGDSSLVYTCPKPGLKVLIWSI